ncbi:MAG: hypothetical protein E7330_08085 [Clostridiales bacterium]|nr:hypothetical protein [Clostridiales bacterium]
MANGINNADKLLDRIMEDAKAEAAKIEAAAAAEAEVIAAKAEKEAAAIAAEAEKKAAAALHETIEHAETAAKLDARKQALGARRAVLDEAFEAALQKLRAMEGEARISLLVKMACGEADGGETITFAKAEEAYGAAVLEEANKALAAAGKKPLAAGAADASIAGGFKLLSGGYEKDCSFEAMLRESRDRLEGGVAKLLFE